MAGIALGAGVRQTEVRVGLRTGWLRHVGVAVGGASGAAIVLGGYEVLRSQPDKSFQLLQVWGPAFLVAMVAIMVFGRLLEGLIQAIRDSFGMVATSVHDSADAASRTADALTRLADQGGKQAQEVQRLAIYAAQEFPGLYTRLDRQDEILEHQSAMLVGLTQAMQTLTSRGNDGH